MGNNVNLICPQCSHINPSSSSNCQTCNWQLINEQIDQTKYVSFEKFEAEFTINAQQVKQNKSSEFEQVKLINHLNDFDIHQVLGKGGMGTVYQASDKTLQRDVAIKILSNDILESKYSDILLDEARMASKLNHTNIVTIYDVARSENNNYIVMEWVKGKPLSELIPDRGLPFITALYYAQQIAYGLSFAHEKYIVHRDIKPQNIMINNQDQIKILDFGIANLFNPKENRSKSREPNKNLGTPQYMSPEQIQGIIPDHRSDIFSFGIVFYQMLCGENPFKGKDITTLYDSICSGNYIPIQQILPELPVRISKLVDKLLSPQRNERWQNTEELSQEIHAIYKEHTDKKNWWQSRHWLGKAAIILPFIFIISWSLQDILFPASTQQLLEKRLQEATKIAILPFDNISGDPEIQIFSDGLAVNLSSDLSAIASEKGNTWILPSSETRRIENLTPKSVSDKYGVNLILTGSIQHMGSTRLLVLNLLNASNGQPLKTTEININAEQLFQAHSLVREEALSLLNWSITENSLAKFNALRPQLDGAYKEYVKGRGYLYRYDQNNNLDKSMAAFKKAVKLDPSYQNAYIGMAEVIVLFFNRSMESHWLDDLTAIIDKLESINSNHNQINNLRANVAMKQGNYELAVQLYQSSIAQSPRLIQAKRGLARAYSKLGDNNNAEKIFNQVIQQAPNNWRLISDVGMFYFKNGNYNKSLNYFKKLIKISPNNHFGYTLTAAAYYSMDDLDNAIDFTKKSIELEPTDNAYSNLGTMLFSTGKYEDAIGAYKSALEISQDNYIIWGNLADAYKASEKPMSFSSYEQASELAQLSLKTNSNDSYTKSHLSYYLANLNNTADALFYASQINENNTGLENFITALTYEQLGMTEESIRHLVFAVDKNYPINEITNTPFLKKAKNNEKFSMIINQTNN
ncbi:MAG: protein kinase [Marinicellaceae bacterium]